MKTDSMALKYIGLCTVLFFIVISGYASNNKGNQDPAQDQAEFVRFKIKSLGMWVDGAFEKFSSNIQYDKSNPANSKFSGTISVTSVNTGINKRDNHLRTDDYFDVEKFPNIIYESTSVQVIDASSLKVKGNITIKNVKKSIDLEVKILRDEGKTVFFATGTMDRRDYGVGGNSFILGDELVFEIQFVQ